MTVCRSVTRCIEDRLLMLPSVSFKMVRLDISCDIGANESPSEAVLVSKVFVSYLIE